MRHGIRDHYGSTVEVIRAQESAKKKGDAHQSTFARMHDLHPGGRRDADAALQDAGATLLLLQRALSLDAYIPRESCRARSRDV